MDLKETGCDIMASIHQAQDKVQRQALVNAAMNLRVLQDRGSSLINYATTSV
jgi:hypothetical protein